MITALIMTIVVLMLLGLAMSYAMPPIGNPMVQWAIRAISVLIAILIILRIWGISV